MENKFLTKIALFGLSKKEKVNKLHMHYWMETNNVYSDHFNKHIGNANKDFDAKYPKHNIKENPGVYGKHIVSHMEKPEIMNAMREEHKPIAEKYTKEFAKHGVKVSDTYFDDFVSGHHADLSTI